jgi:hypothetical protein
VLVLPEFWSKRRVPWVVLPGTTLQESHGSLRKDDAKREKGCTHSASLTCPLTPNMGADGEVPEKGTYQVPAAVLG